MIPSKLYSLEERIQVWEDGGKMCHYCDKKLPRPGTKGGRRTQFDHIIPKSEGGSHDLSNLVICCRRCNLDKGKKDYLLFLQGKRESALVTYRRLSYLIRKYQNGKAEME